TAESNREVRRRVAVTEPVELRFHAASAGRRRPHPPARIRAAASPPPSLPAPPLPRSGAPELQAPDRRLRLLARRPACHPFPPPARALLMMPSCQGASPREGVWHRPRQEDLPWLPPR